MVSMLLINGANINAVNKDGKTPLRLAIEQKDPDLINRLLAYFPTIDPTNINAATNPTPIAQPKSIVSAPLA